MGNIKIIKGVFDTKLELEHAEVAAGFPINIDYSHETLGRDSEIECQHQEKEGMKDFRTKYIAASESPNNYGFLQHFVVFHFCFKLFL